MWHCDWCYVREREHYCVARVSIHKAKRFVSEWVIPEQGDTNDGKIYAQIAPRRHYKNPFPLSRCDLQECQYVLNADRRKKHYRDDGTSYYPTASDNNTVISMRPVLKRYSPSADEMNMWKTRWLKCAVNQHYMTGSQPLDEEDIEDRVNALCNENLIIRYLHDNKQRLLDGYGQSPVTSGPAIEIRLSEALIDLHDNNHGTIVLLGKSDVMESVAQSLTSVLQTAKGMANRTESCRASGMIAVPLHVAIYQSKRNLVDIAMEKLANHSVLGPLVEKFRLESEIQLQKQIDQLLTNWKQVVFCVDENANNTESNLFGNVQTTSPLCSVQDCSLLLAVYIWSDKCALDLVCRKRCLGETSLEGALRELRQGITLDLTNAPVRGKDQHDISDLDFEWFLSHQLKAESNFYFFFHQSMRVSPTAH